MSITNISRKLKGVAYSCLLALLLALPAMASDVFVSNNVFGGPVAGAGSELSLGLEELARSLGFETTQLEDRWTLEGFDIKVREDSTGTVWIDLKDLPKELVKIVYSQELNTVDIYRREVVSSGFDEEWAGEGTLVFFYGDFSLACRAMYPTIMALKQSPTLDVKLLDVEVPKDKVFRKYSRHFEGNKIPYIVIFDDRGRKLRSFAGFRNYPDVISELKAAFEE